MMLKQYFIPQYVCRVFKACNILYGTKVSYELLLSTIVLNSRDWSEIIWLLKICTLKINLAGMHWLGRNDAVP